MKTYTNIRFVMTHQISFIGKSFHILLDLSTLQPEPYESRFIWMIQSILIKINSVLTMFCEIFINRDEMPRIPILYSANHEIRN